MFIHDNNTFPFVINFNFLVKILNCRRWKAPIAVSIVTKLCLSSYTIHRFTRFGADNVQTRQHWTTQCNKGQFYGVCRFCSCNRLFLSSHSKYKFLKYSNFLNFPYIHIIYIYS
jgi:hypothetical protein